MPGSGVRRLPLVAGHRARHVARSATLGRTTWCPGFVALTLSKLGDKMRDDVREALAVELRREIGRSTSPPQDGRSGEQRRIETVFPSGRRFDLPEQHTRAEATRLAAQPGRRTALRLPPQARRRRRPASHRHRHHRPGRAPPDPHSGRRGLQSEPRPRQSLG